MAGQWGRVKPPGHSETQASKAADWLMGCLPEDVAIPETTPDDEEAA